MESVESDRSHRGLEGRLERVQTLASLIDLAERELGGIAVEWRALLEVLGVDPGKVLYKPTGRAGVWQDFEGSWFFSVDPHATFMQACEELLYELARACYRSKSYCSSFEVELLARLARWLAAMAPNYLPNPELVLKPAREEVKKAVELARLAGVELDEGLVEEFERRPSSAVLWALGALMDMLLAIGLEESIQKEKFIFYLAKVSRGSSPDAAVRDT